jgi:hypothetical protein
MLSRTPWLSFFGSFFWHSFSLEIGVVEHVTYTFNQPTIKFTDFCIFLGCLFSFMPFIVLGIVELFFIPQKFNHLVLHFQMHQQSFPLKTWYFFQKRNGKSFATIFLDGENKNISVSLVFWVETRQKNPYNSESLILPNSRTSSKQQKTLLNLSQLGRKWPN